MSPNRHSALILLANGRIAYHAALLAALERKGGRGELVTETKSVLAALEQALGLLTRHRNLLLRTQASANDD
jgi:hypothetical protein